ncbi:glutamine synthetase family protein [Arenibaculum sp.]|uniref:glutamine synthetase family protein n=1 Tax=Arenibaculum sp. TaxID=2865862 RepID=UPI002E1526C7|nr:glutamine synthetase family protein [Arenibaculum sp.]
MDADAAREFLARNGVRSVYVAYSDIHGVVRGKRFPLAGFARIVRDGMRNCCGVFSKDATGTPVEATGILWENGADDNQMRPCLETLALAPWSPDAAIVLADVFDADGSPLPQAPRHVLRRVVERFRAATGAEPVVGCELEFTVQRADGVPPSAGTQAYSLQQMTLGGPFLDTLAAALETAGIPVGSIAAENSDGQFEIGLDHCGALAQADRMFLAKHLVKAVAAGHGWRATFMGMPATGASPNGLHVNLSLRAHGADGPGRTLFEMAGGRPNRAMAGAIAGLLAHSDDALSLLLPTLNSFKAPYADTFFPRQASWGLDNRSTLVRVPETEGEGCRIEYRLPTADANPYLAVATVLGMVERGLADGRELPAAVAGNGFARTDLPQLDFHFDRALDRLAAREWLHDLLGAAFTRTFLTVKRAESERLQAVVTDWERSTYGTFL